MLPVLGSRDPHAGRRQHERITPSTSSSTSLVHSLGAVEQGQIEAGLWRDGFLALGGRLRAIYGGDVVLNEASGNYLVRRSDGDVQIGSVREGADVPAVRVFCPVMAISAGDVGLWQFALRENARLALVRLSYDDGGVVGRLRAAVLRRVREGAGGGGDGG